jgi:DNA damage-binding protein 1
MLPTFARPTTASKNQLLYATSSGSIGVVCELDAKTSETLSNLQRNMRRVVPSAGQLDHAECVFAAACGSRSQMARWRKFKDDTRVQDSVGFIDGAFVEEWSSLSAAQREETIQGRSEAERLLQSAEELTAVVEDLARLAS